MAGVREEEFDEGDVWDVLQGDHHQVGSTEAAAAAAFVVTPPRNRRARSGKDKKPAVAKSDGMVMSRPRPSAPVAIPAGSGSSRLGGGGEEDEEDGGEMLPPHEWLARKMGRMGVSSPPDQACRGRSKSRELTKIRDALLPKTAFSEQ